MQEFKCPPLLKKGCLLFFVGLCILRSEVKAQRIYASSQVTGTTTGCTLCSFQNPINSVSQTSFEDYSVAGVPGGVYGSIFQTLIFPNPNINVGQDSLVVDVESEDLGADGTSFDNLTVQIFNGSRLINSVSGPGLPLIFYENKKRARIVFQPGDQFDRVRISLMSRRVESSSLRIYYAYHRKLLAKPDANGTVYVKKGGMGTKTGDSWANAAAELADALMAARLLNTPTSTVLRQIWVAAGTYKPMYSPEDGENFGLNKNELNSFMMVKDVKVYGGFSGTETSLSQRDVSAINRNKTILSGDLMDNDEIGKKTDNANHVIISVGPVGTAELNGFSIVNGDAHVPHFYNVNGKTISADNGGGMYNINSSPTLSNLTFIGNESGTYGGAMYNQDCYSLITNVKFINNRNRGLGGGAIFNKNSRPVITNCLFYGNSGRNDSGIASDDPGVIYVNNCTFYIGPDKNAIYFPQNAGWAEVVNTVIWGNKQNFEHHNFYNCLVEGRNDKGNINGKGLTARDIFNNTDIGDFTLKKSSPAINAGDNTFYSEGRYPDLSAVTTDLDGNPRIVRTTIDLGAYETAAEQQTINPIADVIKKYGDATFEPIVTATSGLQVSYVSTDPAIAETFQDNADGNKWKIKIKKAGWVTITASQAGAGNVDPAIDVTFTLTIAKKELTITANNQSKVYDGTAHNGGNGISYSGFVSGEDEKDLRGTLVYTGTAQAAVNTGNYTIIPSGLISANYVITYVNGSLDISASAANVLTFNAQTAGGTVVKTYGDAILNASAVASSGLAAGYHSSNPSVATINAQGQVQVLGVGTTTITASQAGDANYLVATPIAFTLDVLKKSLIITAKDYSKTYDGQAYRGGNGLSYAGFVNGDTESRLTGTPVYSGSSQGAVNTGRYPIVPAGLSAANYELSYTAGTLSIVATGNNVLTFNTQNTGGTLNRTYGDGLINATATASSGLPVGYLSSNPAVAEVDANGTVRIRTAGNATITASQPGNSNHQAAIAISFNLAVGQKELTITAGNVTKNYDGVAYSGGDGLVYSGFVNGEKEKDLSGILIYKGSSQGAKDVGSYFISPSGYTSTNYVITYKDGSLTILKAAVQIIAGAKSKTYGDIDPLLTYTSSGLIPGELFTGTLNRTVGEATGSYAITQGTLSAGGNYSVTYTGASLRVDPKALRVMANNQRRTYDGIAYNGGNGVIYEGFVPGENEMVLNGSLGYGGTSQGAVQVGNYVIAPLGLNSANYTITYTKGSLTIDKATVQIIAAAKSKTYGDTDPMLTYTATGLASGDVITGALSRVQGENAGTYAISSGDLSAGDNYNLAYSGASLNVNKALLTISAGTQQMCEGGRLPVLSVNYSGFKFNDDQQRLNTLPSVKATGNQYSPAGSYVLSVSGATAANYIFNYIDGVLKINALPVFAISSNKGNRISKGETVILSASGTVSYFWDTHSSILTGQQSAAITVRPKETTTYTVTGTNASGCTQVQSFTITVLDDLEKVIASNILSPNNDGYNDKWVVDNIDFYPNNTVRVFDKSGRIVFSMKGYDNSWDGSFNGSTLAENTYYYIIDFGTGRRQLKGFITLITAN